jgi:hypothetical protein
MLKEVTAMIAKRPAPQILPVNFEIIISKYTLVFFAMGRLIEPLEERDRRIAFNTQVIRQAFRPTKCVNRRFNKYF